MTAPFLLVIALIALLLLPAGVLIGWQVHKLIARIEHLEKQLGKRNLPERVKDGLEDVTAILNDMRWRGETTDKVFNGLTIFLQELAADRAYQDSRIDNALTIAKTLRTEHVKYDPDMPNNKHTVGEKQS